jgi:ribosomal protein S18 acetylase RimI-like enzyme
MNASTATRRSPAQAAPYDLVLRPARETDHVPVQFFFDTALRRDYFLRRGQLADMLRQKHHRVLVAELDGVLVGIAVLTRGERLVNVLVHPAYRGLRIGRALVEASSAREVRAKIDVSSGDPRPFYKSLGFRRTGRFNRKGNIELLRRAAIRRARRGAPAKPATAATTSNHERQVRS